MRWPWPTAGVDFDVKYQTLAVRPEPRERGSAEAYLAPRAGLAE